ncbi:GTP-binding protein [Streptomyces sp. ATCC51928]|uniref:CobW family GTP-binding protein n=1 Tax=Streptomyces caviscabies TaxID=90079 RepID=A0ABW2MEE2_9ACTN|nr:MULTISPECIES: CobW family GTP-binding protein [unclassified Streptomyces]MDX3502265.1 GTP-binding protein [Streptomyces sp. ATCC51928]MDX5522615.1 GTP-binding protein [Streptomyces sp. DE06-01C]
MTPPRTPQIPVVVLAGFLGSGKTTLLNHLLRNRAGTRIGVIVNDFGAIEIDAMTVSGQVGSTVSLGNGCLCCAVDASELDTFLETLTRPSARLDVIVIEASGLAEPQELVRMLLASDNPHIRYGGLVEVVDAAEFDSTRERHPELDRHLAVADLVVLNKTDRVGEAERERLRATVAELSGPAAVISAVHGRIDPELLFDPALRPDHEEMAGQLSFEDLLRQEECDEHEECDGHGHGDHLHASYESVDFTADVPLDPRRFMAFLDSRPEGLYRIKGFADFGAGDRDNTYALHAVGRFLRFVPRPWARGEQRLTQLVMIGAGIDAEALLAGLAACRADEPAPDATTSDASTTDVSADADADAVERGMWGVLRYVQEHAPEPQEAAAEA